jgi:hypothetical protein
LTAAQAERAATTEPARAHPGAREQEAAERLQQGDLCHMAANGGRRTKTVSAPTSDSFKASAHDDKARVEDGETSEAWKPLLLRASACGSARPRRERRSRAAAARGGRRVRAFATRTARKRQRLPQRAHHTAPVRGASVCGAQSHGGDAAQRRMRHARTTSWDVVYDAEAARNATHRAATAYRSACTARGARRGRARVLSKVGYKVG